MLSSPLQDQDADGLNRGARGGSPGVVFPPFETIPHAWPGGDGNRLDADEGVESGDPTRLYPFHRLRTQRERRMTLYRIRPEASAFLRRKFSTPPAIGRLVKVHPAETAEQLVLLEIVPDEANPAAVLLSFYPREWPEWERYLQEVEA